MREDTSIPKKERILDAAEELFALHGFDGVTLRQIAKKSEVDVALPAYHFGKKRDLFEAAFLRRAKILNDARRVSLRETESRHSGKPPVEEIVAAFLRPIQQFQLSNDPGWRHYLALVAYINASSVWGEEMMHKHYDPLVSEYIEALQRAFPDTDPRVVHWCYHYLSGALTLTLAQTGRINRLSDGLCQSSDVQTAYDLMIPFIAAGFREMCNGRGTLPE